MSANQNLNRSGFYSALGSGHGSGFVPDAVLRALAGAPILLLPSLSRLQRDWLLADPRWLELIRLWGAWRRRRFLIARQLCATRVGAWQRGRQQVWFYEYLLHSLFLIHLEFSRAQKTHFVYLA